MTFKVITIFPEAFDSYIKASILGRAVKKKLIKINLINLRRFTKDKHKTVDDKPFGGGPGMVMKIEPIYKAVEFAKRRSPNGKRTKVILFSTRGKKFNSKIAKRLAKSHKLILICGRYEGVDERVAKYVAHEEISIGDYILSGGELPALILIEAVSRYVPGVLGNKESLEDIKGSYPVYTRPAEFKSWKVPKVLLSGNHKAIENWRNKHSRKF